MAGLPSTAGHATNHFQSIDLDIVIAEITKTGFDLRWGGGSTYFRKSEI